MSALVSFSPQVETLYGSLCIGPCGGKGEIESNKEFQGKKYSTQSDYSLGCMQRMSSVNTHTQISPLTLNATTYRCRPHKGYILKITNQNEFPTLHTRHIPMTDTLLQLCELHLRGHYPVLSSFFSFGHSGPITESNHMDQSQNSGPITKSNHMDKSQGPSFSNTAAMCKTASYLTPC